MKLSDIKGERTFEVIADLIEPISNIASDERAAGLFSRERPTDMEPREFALRKARENAPALIRDHKDDLVAIFSTLEGVSAEEYVKGLTMGSLIGDLYTILTDKDLLAFLS